MKFFWQMTAAMILSVSTARAQPAFEGNFPPGQPLQEYFAAEDENYNKSIIYIFYNNDECYQCPQTIELTEQIFNRYYNGRYSLFVINYAEDDMYNFAGAYRLDAPLSIVLVKISDGESLGWQKIDNPQNLIEATEDYTQYLTERINNFLGQ